jgi:uncharacterized protein
VSEAAREAGIKPGTLEAKTISWREKMCEAREARVHPARDEKVITAWSSLMVSALARGYAVTRETRYRVAAQEGARFILKNLVEGDRVYRCWMDGRRDLPGTLEDYACVAGALLDLYETTFDLSLIEASLRVVGGMNSRLWDARSGGYYSSETRPDLILRLKDGVDGAIPSGNSLAAMVLARLGRLTSNDDLLRRAECTIEQFAGGIGRSPISYPYMLMALDFLRSNHLEIVLAADPENPGGFELLKTIHGRFLPNMVLARAGGPDAERAVRLVPMLEGKKPLGGKPTVYVCCARVCRKPATTVEELREEIDRR